MINEATTAGDSRLPDRHLQTKPHARPLNPLPGPSDTTANVDEIRFHRKQQQLYCFSKDATHNKWTTSQSLVNHSYAKLLLVS